MGAVSNVTIHPLKEIKENIVMKIDTKCSKNWWNTGLRNQPKKDSKFQFESIESIYSIQL